MAQLNINNLSYYYDDYYHAVFEDVTLNLDSDWKLGLIGRNGRGKSTLLDLLAGTIAPSKGKITYAGTISKYPYDYNGDYTRTMDVVKECIGNLRTMELRMEELLEDGGEKALEEYFELQEHFVALDGYDVENDIKRELDAFGFDETILDREYATLSGGEKSCMLIIAMFLRKDSFVLLDEPTTHLDDEHSEILKNYLISKHGYIVVSHDFDFLDEVSDHILAIQKCDITLWKGNYSSWKRNEDEKEASERKEEERLIEEIDYLDSHAKKMREWAEFGNEQSYDYKTNARTNGNRTYMRQAKRSEQKIQDDLEAKKQLLRNIEEEKALQISQSIDESEFLVFMKDFSYSYDGKHPLFEHINLSVFAHDRLWIRGKNGAGKTTLIRLIMGQLEENEGSGSFNDSGYDGTTGAGKIDKTARTGIMRKEGLKIAYASQEPEFVTGMIIERLQEENAKAQREHNEKTSGDGKKVVRYDIDRFRALCDVFDLPEDIFDRPLETLSSGELKKVNIALAICKKHDILILDEPLNYMDALFRAQLESTLVEQNLTVIFVDHNKNFGRTVSTKMLYLG